MRDENDHSVRETLCDQKSTVRREAISEEVNTSKFETRQHVVRIPDKKEVKHSSFVLLRKRDENGNLSWHSASVVERCSEEIDYHQDSLFAVVHYAALKLLSCISTHKNLAETHGAFKSAFPNRPLHSAVNAEFSNYIYCEKTKRTIGKKLKPDSTRTQGGCEGVEELVAQNHQ